MPKCPKGDPWKDTILLKCSAQAGVRKILWAFVRLLMSQAYRVSMTSPTADHHKKNQKLYGLGTLHQMHLEMPIFLK